MKVCHNCGHENNEGVLFCERCGVALGVISLSTKQLGEGEENLSAGSERLSEDHIVFIYVQGFEDPLTVQVRDRVILGRSGGADDDLTTLVNLDAYGAEEHGVSRRHAALIRDERRLEVVDLGSTNHTYLNGQQLLDTDQSVVHDGDELRLGYLQLRIFFK
jgi:hypothetical protein